MTADYLRDRLTAAVGDHFLIEDELGRGGMAAVFRALDVRLNRRVAIKLLPPELAFNADIRSRFLREAQLAAQLSHPNIVPIYTVDERGGLVYFVMALVNGESVARLLAREGAFDVARAREIVAAVADALDYAHGQGVVHRDIKPDNILIGNAGGRPMVTDFGIARALAEESRLTVTGIAVGTPAYMSPEQALGEREVDGRSDIYSLGVVAYQMLAGETPFRAVNTPAMLMKHVSESPPPLRSRRGDVPAALAAAIDRALAKSPEHRWSSAGQFRDALLGRGSAAQLPAHHAPPAPPALPPAPPHPAHDYEVEHRTDAKIASFRRRFAGYVATSVMLFAINMVTTRFPWFIFPVLGMGIGIVIRLGELWGDGVPLRRIFGVPARRSGGSLRKGTSTSAPSELPAVANESLSGPHGSVVQRARSNQGAVRSLLDRMNPNERAMLPAELLDTVDALVDRVTAIAGTLHRLDADASGATLGSLDARIETLRREPGTAESTRRLGLLQRQRSTVHDLLERRGALLAQLDSAALALENLRLDLVRFCSAGVSSALEDVTSATRQARAVSRDIGLMLDAADEVRKL